MKRTLTAASLALALSTNLLATEATADEALMDGVRPFICDGEAVVFLESNNGWVISTDPTAEVKPIDNGWRYEDSLSGYVWYLREESRNSWVIEGLSEDGYLKADCMDVANSVSQVVTIIKPRLDENMMAQLMDIQAQLAETKGELRDAQAQLVTTSARPKTRPNRPAPAPPSETTSASDDAAVAAALAAALAATAPDLPAGPPMTGSETEGFRLAIGECWVVDTGGRSANVKVTVAFSLDRSGKVAGDVRQVTAEGGEQAAVDTAFRAARTAILRCGASGYDLPADKYDQWREVEITFDPSGMRLR